MQTEQGWVHLLNRQLEQEKAPYRIHNESVSGETTGGGLTRLPALLDTQDVDHLIIELGGNDGLRGYAPKSIKNNLLQMIDLAQQKNIPVTVIKIRIPPNYGPRYSKMFEQVYDQVANEKNVPLLPFFVAQVATTPELMQEDDIHPNAKAQPLIAEYVKQQLTTLVFNSPTSVTTNESAQ